MENFTEPKVMLGPKARAESAAEGALQKILATEDGLEAFF